MLHPKAVPFRCCFALLALQVFVFSVYAILIFTEKRNLNVIKMAYFNRTGTELYMSGDMNLTSEKSNDECARNFLESYSKYCEIAIVPSLKVLKQYYDSAGDFPGKDLCPCLPQNLTGNVNLNMSSVKLSSEIFNGLRPGGHWTPSWCIPRQRIAIIIPFRDRASHLDLFLQVFHPFLQNQLHSYSIFVIEQKDPVIFNKAAMMNVGFDEITKRSDRVFDCFIFHDVDTLPQDDRNIYGCYKVPRHVAAYLDKFNYRLNYYKMFGGATAFTQRQFQLSNGYSNEYWGWGGEDDDMEKRISAANFSFMRFPKCVARYTMIKHERDTGNPRNQRASTGWQYRPDVYKRDGLNTLKYTLVAYEERLLYTKIIASLTTAGATRRTTTKTTTKTKTKTKTKTTSKTRTKTTKIAKTTTKTTTKSSNSSMMPSPEIYTSVTTDSIIELP